MLGILGGMGPLAGAAFAARLVALTPAERDQDHIPALLCNDPRVPDRSAARLGQGEDPLEAMAAGIRLLEAAGVSLIAIPCNTAHLWFEQLAARTRVPLLHIVEAVCDDLGRLGVRGPIGLMGTPATLKLGLYQRAVQARGWDVLLPDEEGLAQCVQSIAAVKGNRPADAFEPAAQCIRSLVARGADAIVLGCTELPLAVPHERRHEFGAELTDSIDALAKAALARYGRTVAANQPLVRKRATSNASA